MIEVGEYVRNTFGDIYKVENLNGDPMFLTDKFYNRIAKHSKNIIDLIEEGDYVNGEKVVNKNDDRRELVLRNDTGFQYINKGNQNNIKSIVTKEKFEAMEYKVKE